MQLYPVEENLVVRTDTEAVDEQLAPRRLELLLAEAPESQDLAQLAAELGVDPDAAGEGRGGQVHSLRAVRADVQRA